jgi:hypothetical protein
VGGLREGGRRQQPSLSSSVTLVLLPTIISLEDKVAQPRMIANKGQLFDVEFHQLVHTIVQIMAYDDIDVSEFAWYIQPIDNDARIGSMITINHKEEGTGGEEIENLLTLPIIMTVNGIDGKMLWRAGIDIINRVVGIRYRRRGS